MWLLDSSLIPTSHMCRLGEWHLPSEKQIVRYARERRDVFRLCKRDDNMPRTCYDDGARGSPTVKSGDIGQRGDGER